MSIITKEQAQKIIEAADEIITALAGTNDDVHPDNSTKMVRLYDDLNDHYAPPEVVRELARIALASLELERGMIRRFDLDMSDCDSCGQDCGADMVEDLDGEYVLWDEVLPHLYRYDEYTVPPAPVSVPDEDLLYMAASAIEDLLDHCDPNTDYYSGVWADVPAKLRRAAMLQSADGNSPVIPDGWKLVPIEPTEKMVIEGFESEPDEFFSKSEEWEAYQEMSGCHQAAHRARLCWAAMIAAAPKPEV
ncbi:DUF551 domain-containing protein [Enterobacter asburiae]|uniref:DUF551 domain-containing protein n=1 Tax=Enterobacter asburiae TaxID=61645 RepID=A0A8I1G3A5_ENTAS|nr:DUF551 domain-containing protein [Enterobacter asburiae]MBJ6597470.1 DUF551 domain-containing protein [Enterobacter asburiae]